MAKKNKKKRLDPKLRAWVEARKRFRLSHAQVQMARELGMNPKKLGALANHDQEPWKEPLPQYIEHLYEERFGRTVPESVLSIEERARRQQRKKAARREAKRRRRSSAAESRAATKPTAQPSQRALLATMTNEPFQPVRLYYRVSDRPRVMRTLRALRCTVEERAGRCWQWIFEGEAASLELPRGGYDDVPEARRPIILGRIRLPKEGGLTLQTGSTDRAVQGARFFASHFGSDVVPTRCRVVNRCFAADEGSGDELMKTLDRDDSVIDPSDAEKEMAADFEGVPSMADAERVAQQRLQRKLAAGKDVPLVEDFPLHPEEETPDFQHLAVALQLRSMRALEHWRGNTHLTLTAIIMRTVEEGANTTGTITRPG